MSALIEIKKSALKTLSSLKYYWYILRQNPLTSIGLTITLLLTFIGLFAPWLSPYDPYKTDPLKVLQPPSFEHPFGTDSWGRDIMSRVFYATSLDLFLAISSVLMSATIGIVVGALSGYYEGKLSIVVMRIVDVLLSFPSFLLGLALMVGLGAGVTNLFITQTIIRVPIFARQTCGEILSVKRNEYSEAAVCVGNKTHRIIFYHLLPNCITPILVLITMNFGYAILEIAALSFLGLGIKPPTAEWGIMVAYGAPYILAGVWHVSVFPGLFIFISVLAFNLVGDGIRDLLERKVR